MVLESLDTLFYTSIFILPGFIINFIIESINPPKKHNEGIYFLKCIYLSIINCAIWSWLYKIIIFSEKLSVVCMFVLLVLLSIIGPILMGFAIAILKQKQIIDRALSIFKIRTIHSIPTAWDYYFSKQKSTFVIITLLDDTKLYGWYSANSFSSSEPEERDIYIEKAYKYVDENWDLDCQSGGFYIPKEQIKFIEFKKGEKE